MPENQTSKRPFEGTFPSVSKFETRLSAKASNPSWDYIQRGFPSISKLSIVVNPQKSIQGMVPWFSNRIVCNIFIPITLIALATMWTVKAFKVSESISAVCESSPATEDLEASKQNFSSQNYLHIASKCNSTFQDCCQILALYQSCIMPGISGVFSSDNITNWGNIWVRNLVWFILQVCCSALFAK